MFQLRKWPFLWRKQDGNLCLTMFDPYQNWLWGNVRQPCSGNGLFLWPSSRFFHHRISLVPTDKDLRAAGYDVCHWCFRARQAARCMPDVTRLTRSSMSLCKDVGWMCSSLDAAVLGALGFLKQSLQFTPVVICNMWDMKWSPEFGHGHSSW